MILSDASPKTSQLFRSEEASHYYKIDGTPVYGVPNKSKPGTERKTTITDGKKMGLVPSVTTIQRILDKPALNAWRCEMAVIAALTLTREPDEPLDAFAKRVAEDADTIRDTAADKGKLIHAACEDYARQWLANDGWVKLDDQSPIYEHMVHFQNWWNANVIEVESVEQVVVSPLFGYAGTRDLRARLIGVNTLGSLDSWTTLDFKSQKIRNGKPVFYDEWAQQLAAYDCADAGTDTLMSVVISSGEPMPVMTKVWTPVEKHKALDVWGALVHLWYVLKDYPRPGAVVL